MKSREDIIKGLECCIDYDYKCKFCPFADDGGAEDFCYSDELKADALALLKAQEDTRLTPRNPYHTKVAYKDGDEEGYWITDQCPECVERGELGIWDTLVDRPVKYCRRCGQALDWSEYNGRDEIDWDEYMSHVNERAKRMAERRRSGNET